MDIPTGIPASERTCAAEETTEEQEEVADKKLKYRGIVDTIEKIVSGRHIDETDRVIFHARKVEDVFYQFKMCKNSPVKKDFNHKTCSQLVSTLVRENFLERLGIKAETYSIWPPFPDYKSEDTWEENLADVWKRNVSTNARFGVALARRIAKCYRFKWAGHSARPFGIEPLGFRKKPLEFRKRYAGMKCALFNALEAAGERRAEMAVHMTVYTEADNRRDSCSVYVPTELQKRGVEIYNHVPEHENFGVLDTYEESIHWPDHLKEEIESRNGNSPQSSRISRLSRATGIEENRIKGMMKGTPPDYNEICILDSYHSRDRKNHPCKFESRRLLDRNHSVVLAYTKHFSLESLDQETNAGQDGCPDDYVHPHRAFLGMIIEGWPSLHRYVLNHINSLETTQLGDRKVMPKEVGQLKAQY